MFQKEREIITNPYTDSFDLMRLEEIYKKGA